jgi:aminoglycoside N3'-acetyltransferase
VPRSRSRSELLASHLQALTTLAQSRDIWIPTFNYDFLQSGLFDTASDPSQVGPITESFRKAVAAWRTLVPVFNFGGTGARPPGEIADGATVDPFDSSSPFAIVGSFEGTVAWYGAALSSTTLLHHAERMAGGPVYRYDKTFRGVVTHAGRSRQLSLNYHVRPIGHHLDYDWSRLERETLDAGVVHLIGGHEHLRWAPARQLTDFWVAQLRDDPLALLDEESRLWVDRRLQELGRPFSIEDFE